MKIQTFLEHYNDTEIEIIYEAFEALVDMKHPVADKIMDEYHAAIIEYTKRRHEPYYDYSEAEKQAVKDYLGEVTSDLIVKAWHANTEEKFSALFPGFPFPERGLDKQLNIMFEVILGEDDELETE